MKRKNFTLSELATYTSSKLIGDPNHLILGVADLESASEQDVSFLGNSRYLQAMRRSEAGAIFIDSKTEQLEGKNYLIHENPSLAFQITLEAFHEKQTIRSGFTGIHSTAVIDKTARIGKDVTVSPYAVIDQGVDIGDGTFVGAGCYIGPFTKIGKGCILHAHVMIRESCTLGNNVIIQPGAIIGSCGFGYITDRAGNHVKLDHVGTVVIEDEVEIGANSTIDRGRFKVTLIGKGSKIDNLVQIAHNVIVGEKNIFAAQTGIAGSTKTGKYVITGGQVAISGHVKIGDHVMLAGRSAVSKSLLEAGKYSGVPAVPIEEHNRNSVFLRNIEKYVALLKDLEKRFQK